MIMMANPEAWPGGASARPNDAELVQRVRDGDAQAFESLTRRYARRAQQLAHHMLGNEQDAQEVCQEAWLRVHRSLAGLDDAHRFGAWFLRIVTNLALNLRRDRACRARQKAIDSLPDAHDLEALRDRRETSAPGARLAGEELGTRLLAALAGLQPAQRLALVLFSVEGLPQRDVAEIMGCSVEAVKWHVFQARRRLREAGIHPQKS